MQLKTARAATAQQSDVGESLKMSPMQRMATYIEPPPATDPTDGLIRHGNRALGEVAPIARKSAAPLRTNGEGIERCWCDTGG